MTSLILILSRHDERVLHALVCRRRGGIARLMRVITHLGDAWFTVSLTIGLLLVPVQAVHTVAARIAFGLVASHVFVQILKRSINRPRPRLPVGIESLIAPPDRFSFPSGHAAAALSIVIPLAAALTGPLGELSVLLAMLVGLSRCYLGVHYPGDVIVGWLLAIGAAWLAPAFLLV